MRTAGLAIGGNLNNAIVVDEDKILNPEGLRFGDEFVRHKLLDFIGDISFGKFFLIGPSLPAFILNAIVIEIYLVL